MASYNGSSIESQAEDGNGQHARVTENTKLLGDQDPHDSLYRTLSVRAWFWHLHLGIGSR